jgi:micrococcal nuclease
MYTYQGTVTHDVDGDTLDLQIDLGFSISVQQRVRLLGLNAAERFTPAGKAAIAFVQAWLAKHGPVFTVTTQKDEKDKYGRYLADITSPDGANLNDDLIAAGMAAPWDGKGPAPVPDTPIS